MKKYVKVFLIILLIVCTVLTIIYFSRGFLFKNNKDNNADSTSSEIEINLKSVEIEIVINRGEAYDFSSDLAEDAAPYLSYIEWSSTDEAVVTVDENGAATAGTEGKAVVTAIVGDQTCLTANVEVCQSMEDTVAGVINAFSDNGSDSTYENMQSIRSNLDGWDGDMAEKYAKLLDSIDAFAHVPFNYNAKTAELWKNLKRAAADTGLGISENVLRRAAMTAYCIGEKQNSDMTISFTGDCTFGYFCETDPPNMFASVYRNSGSVSYPFDFVKNVFDADDITMINYEGTITTLTDHKDKPFFFRGEPEYTRILTSSSVEAVTLENNHAFDYYDEGFIEMASYLAGAGVRYTTFSSPAIIEKNDCRVVMLSMSLVSTTYKPEFKEQIEKYIKKYKRNDTVIVVNVHWGEEGSDTPEPWQIDAAHSIIDAGADLIIGHHPHVLQGIELYNGCYIAYSLGNFSFGGNSKALNPKTEILRFSFSRQSEDGMRLRGMSAVPCLTTSSGTEVNNFRPRLLWGDDAKNNLNYLIELSSKLRGGIERITSLGI